MKLKTKVMDENSPDVRDRHSTIHRQAISSAASDLPTQDTGHPSDAEFQDEGHLIDAIYQDAGHPNDTVSQDAGHLSDEASHDEDHSNDAPTQDAPNDIPAVKRASSPNKSSPICGNHDRCVTDERTRSSIDNPKNASMRVDEKSPTELSCRSFFFDASSSSVKGQSSRPVAVVTPMRPSASAATPDSVDRHRPRSSSKSTSSSSGMCQTSQTDPSFSRSGSGPVPAEVAVRHSSDPCGPSPMDCTACSGAGGSLFDANQEQNRIFNQPPNPRKELELLSQSNFFYGHLSRSKVKAKLRHSENGTFLVRFSSDSKFQFALSLKTPNGVTSVRLARTPDGLIRLDCDPAQADRMPAFPSVLDLVVNYVRDATGQRPRRSHCVYLEGVGLSETVLDLNKPFEESPASLGHLCRRRINELVPWHMRMSLIQTLGHVAPKDNVLSLIEFLDAYTYRI